MVDMRGSGDLAQTQIIEAHGPDCGLCVDLSGAGNFLLIWIGGAQ